MAKRQNNTKRHHHVGIVAGTLSVMAHSLWIGMVMLGFAQTVLDFIYGLHFLSNPFMVGEISVVKTVGLLGITFVAGYVVGWVLSYLWDKTTK